MNEQNSLVLITWNSASGKTSAGYELKKRGWKELLSFTTRAPRWNHELDEYVFLTKEQFKNKASLGHFLETVEYNWNYYGLTRFAPKWKVFAIVNEEGRNAVEENSYLLPHKLTKVFIDIDEETRKERLIKRGDSPEEVKKRLKDNFQPWKNDYILSWLADSETLATNIEKLIWI